MENFGKPPEFGMHQITNEIESAETSEDISYDGDPLKYPAEYLEFLKRKNPNYNYRGVDPEMIAKAVEWVRGKGFNPSELSPAQIFLSQFHVPGEKTRAEIVEEMEKARIERLSANKTELASILAPKGKILFFHATPVFENVQSILNNGLYCDSRMGLDGVAVPLDSLSPNTDQNAINQIIESNLRELACPHGGHRYEIIIELPPLTPEQKADFQKRRVKGEPVSRTSYYVQPLSVEAGAIGVERTYDAILPPQYLKGFIDLDTGQFIPR